MKHIALLLDESGSMMNLTSDVIEGTNNYIEKLSKDENADQGDITLFTFDLRGDKPILRVVYAEKPIKNAPKVTAKEYQPFGSTPLVDATYDAIKYMKKLAGKDDVLFMIYTDGYENASTKHKTHELAELVAKREKQGWEFVYFGANQDAWATAQQYGLANAGGTYTVYNTNKGYASTNAIGGTLSSAFLAGQTAQAKAQFAGKRTIEEDDEDVAS